MAGFDFGKISEIISRYFDTASMDIGRNVKIQMPNGTWREQLIDPYIPNIPCHIDFNTTDNPNPASVDTQPIIVSITIRCPIYVDLQNGDFITARQLDSSGNVLETYKGTIGMPRTEQSRKSAVMEMRVGV